MLTTIVSLPPLSEFYLGNLAREFRAAVDAGKLPYIYGAPKNDRPAVALQSTYWRPFVGGALLATRLSWLPDSKQPVTSRAIVTFNDARVAREVLVIDASWARRTAWLQQVEDGNWVLRMRWDDPKTGLVPRKSSRIYWAKKPPRTRFGNRTAPPEWPRDKHGRPISTPKAVTALGRSKVSMLLRRYL